MSLAKKDIVVQLEELKVEFDKEAEAKDLDKILKKAKKEREKAAKKEAKEQAKEKGPEEAPREKKIKKARYISKYAELKLIDKSSYTKEIEGRVVVVEGSSIQFHEGLFETTDQREIEFLENDPNFGSVFVRIKDKDLQKAREEKYKSLTVKQQEEKEEQEKLSEKEKALGEGEGLPKKRTKGKGSTKEKPAF